MLDSVTFNLGFHAEYILTSDVHSFILHRFCLCILQSNSKSSQHTVSYLHNIFDVFQQNMMKIELAMTLFAVFHTTYSQPVMIVQDCRKDAMIGFPFFGEESITLSKFMENHKETGLGYDHLIKQVLDFQNADRDCNNHLTVDELLYEDYRKIENGERILDFEFMDVDKNGLASMSELVNYFVALKQLDPNTSEFSLMTMLEFWTGPDGQLNYEEYLNFLKRRTEVCFTQPKFVLKDF